MAERSLFDDLEGESTILKLVTRFYDLMDSLPEAKTIRDLHNKDLAEAREKLYEFLVGWSGGPPLYESKYGHPRLKMRHMPFPIGDIEKNEWLLCMKKAVEEVFEDSVIRRRLMMQFTQIADFMKNQQEV